MRDTQSPVLVVGGSSDTAEVIVRDLRGLGRISVWAEACNVALDMMSVVNFASVIVSVDDADDWHTCWRIVAASRCPVAVVTHFLARDRRYRDGAFRNGVAAYVYRPYTNTQLAEVLQLIESGEARIEVLGSGVPPDS